MNPKKKSKELKRISRENLNGRYRLSMSVFLTVTLINLFSDLPFTYLLGNVYATKVQTVIIAVIKESYEYDEAINIDIGNNPITNNIYFNLLHHAIPNANIML